MSFVGNAKFGRSQFFTMQILCIFNLPVVMFFLGVPKVLSSCNNFVRVSGGVFFSVVSLAFNVGAG